jgi:septum formation protein
LILASGSPQRRAILEQLGVEFRVEVPDVEERTGGDPREVVVENALRKVRAVEGDLVLGVDTEVVLGDLPIVLGKPNDAKAAESSLALLSGRVHEVMSGIALRDEAKRERTDVAVTRVRFRELKEWEIAWYIRTGEWRDRAGGYAIQGKGAALVEEIEGDYLNVVGLPVAALLRLYPKLLFP